MKVEMYLIARDGTYNATATFDDGKVIVKRGSLLRMTFASHVHGGRIVKRLRADTSILNEAGITQKDCEFNSPSTAAQFVMGSSVNGWTAWHVEKKTNLRKYLEEASGQR